MRVFRENAVDLGKQLPKPRVRKDREPVIARSFAVFEASSRPDCSVLF